MEKSTNNAVIDLDSRNFKSKDYLILMVRIRERENSNKLPDLKVWDGLVYRQTNFSLKKELQKQLARKVWISEDLMDLNHHLSIHDGIGKTVGHLCYRFFWPNMVCQIREYIVNCEKCKSSKAPNQRQYTENEFLVIYCAQREEQLSDLVFASN